MAKKRKYSDPVRGNRIGERLVAKMKREKRGKVVNLGNVIAGRAAAEELQKTVVTKEDLAGFHPAHAAYVYAENQVSVMSEQVTALEEMHRSRTSSPRPRTYTCRAGRRSAR